jgi:dihydrofolate synthase/folylpolyglutamate synthase
MNFPHKAPVRVIPATLFYNEISMSETAATYEAAIAHLNALIPELFSAPGQPRRKFSLHEIGVLCESLGNPQRQFPSVLIAGTNGKGSTASTLASIAREAGLRVGLYTSPHLDRVNERIRLGLPSEGDAEIPDATFARLYFQVIRAAEQLVADGKLPTLPSFFELLTALSFLYFAESKVDLAILEVGMGGRLDATNIVEPLASVITDISLDHQEWLGATIALIAREKAGILRPNGTLITLPQHPEANQAIGEVATELNVRGVPATDYMPIMGTDPIRPYTVQIPFNGTTQTIRIDSPLHGAHQHRNLALAIATAIELAQNHGFPITPAAIERGIRTTRWPGRMELIQIPGEPEYILDVAHNPAGAWALRAALSATPSNPPQTLIFACLRDKPLREMTQILFPLFDQVVLAPIHSPRATDVADLTAAAEATGVPAHPASTVAEAIAIARELTSANGRIVISGSVYLVGEARHLLLAVNEESARKVQLA